MSLHTYDPKKVVLIVGGVPIGGFADGTFINVMRSEDAFTKVVGADGDTTRSKSNDKSGEMEITLLQTSMSNDVLTGFAMADELQNKGAVPVLLKDLSGTSAFASAFGWVRKLPDSEYGKEVSERSWTLDLVDLNMFVGGNPANQ